MRSTRLFSVLAVLVLVLAACSPDDAGDTSTTVAGETTTSSATEPTEPTETTAPVEETTTTQGSTQVDAGCIVGTWEMDSQAFIDQLQSIFAGEMLGATAAHTGGTYIVTIGGDGTFHGVREDWTWEIETAEGTLIQTINSEETGTYTLEGGLMDVDLETNSFDVASSIEVDGQVLDLPQPPGGIQFDDDSFDPAGEVTCDGDELVVHGEEDLELVFTRA